jgi:hypothetical protein
MAGAFQDLKAPVSLEQAGSFPVQLEHNFIELLRGGTPCF